MDGFDASYGFREPKGRIKGDSSNFQKITNLCNCNDNETNPNYNLLIKSINNAPRYPSSVLNKDGFDAS
eukprot:11375136-Ditylum_brightwellii.AAC.1